MPIVATGHERHAGNPVGSGHCVAFVREVTGLPPTSRWRRGEPVRRGGTLAPGTAIATFDAAGRYPNSMSGDSHAAIYVGQDEHGITVWDQWLNQPVQQRVIQFRGGRGKAVDDASRFHVIEVEDV